MACGFPNSYCAGQVLHLQFRTAEPASTWERLFSLLTGAVADAHVRLSAQGVWARIPFSRQEQTVRQCLSSYMPQEAADRLISEAQLAGEELLNVASGTVRTHAALIAALAQSRLVVYHSVADSRGNRAIHDYLRTHIGDRGVIEIHDVSEKGEDECREPGTIQLWGV